jgi:AcrR family transcriptional regulator
MGEETGRSRTGGRRRSPAARPTDDELLDAARAVFAERGFQQATMGAIAERADSTKPTLYSHFGDKDALYRSAVSREADALRRWVTTAYESAATLPVDQQVHVYVMALFTYATAHPEGFRMLFDSPATGDAARIRRGLVDTITERVADQIRRYLAGRDRSAGPSAGLLAAMMVGIVGQAAEYTLRTEDFEPLAAGEIATRFIMAALSNLDPGILEPLDRPARAR